MTHVTTPQSPLAVGRSDVGTPGFARSRKLQQRSHELIPGGCHTYAKGDDQYPWLAPGFIAQGIGCHVWDIDGNEYIEYGMGNRCVTLGHGFSPVVAAATKEMERGVNFGRPSPLEVECAELFLQLIDRADMVKFAKEGSSVTTHALRLARAYTGRDLVACCADHPFFSIHDWFIGTTAMDSGIPQAVSDLTLTFRYGDLDHLQALFEECPGQIAAIILEPAKYQDPPVGYLRGVADLCRAHGAVLIFDEMITGFRWDAGGAQQYYDVTPDLSTFGKALANGFSVSALAGKREIMELGGLTHERERVFLLSTTHGAETHGLAAAMATMRTYATEPVIDVLFQQGERLRTGLNQVIQARGLQDHVQTIGKPCNMVFATLDASGQPSQAFRALFMQELIKRGVIGPSWVVSYAHTDDDIDRTVDAVHEVLPIYEAALTQGPERYLVGPPTKPVSRRFN